MAKLSLDEAIRGAEVSLRIVKEAGQSGQEQKARVALGNFLDTILELSGGKKEEAKK